MRKTRRALCAAVVLVLFGSGCDSGSDTESEKSPAAEETTSGPPPVQLEGTVNNHGVGDLTSADPGEVLEFELDNFYFGPTFIKSAPGATMRLEMHNEGTAQHTFTIDSMGIDEVFDPDATREVEVKLPATGAIRFYCRFHAGQGMQGAFFFNAGDAVVSSSPAAATTTAPAAVATTAAKATATTRRSNSGGSTQTTVPGY